MTIESKTENGARRVVVSERAFGFYTLEVGFLIFKFIPCRPTKVPVIGFAWLGFDPKFHSLN